jgi:hypothetical protein
VGFAHQCAVRGRRSTKVNGWWAQPTLLRFTVGSQADFWQDDGPRSRHLILHHRSADNRRKSMPCLTESTSHRHSDLASQLAAQTLPAAFVAMEGWSRLRTGEPVARERVAVGSTMSLVEGVNEERRCSRCLWQAQVGDQLGLPAVASRCVLLWAEHRHPCRYVRQVASAACSADSRNTPMRRNFS